MADGIAREVFGLLFETGSEAVFVVDRVTAQIVSANVRAEEMLHREVGSLVGVSLSHLLVEADREISAPGHYEEVGLRGSDDYPVYVDLQVAHVKTADGRELAACAARDTSERRILERELVAKHSALVTAHVELERAHAQLGQAARELEDRNRRIALLAWRGAMGELVAGIAHHLNNPVGALASSLRRMTRAVGRAPDDVRDELEHQLARIGELARRIESNVAAIVQASRSSAPVEAGALELPPELASVLAAFVARLDGIPTRGQS